jgi:hypothetical protein
MTEFTIRDDHALANRGFGFAVATDLCRHCGKALGEHFGATLACNEADATKVTFIGAEAGKCIAYGSENVRVGPAPQKEESR